ncbi:hypothetical protein [Halodesulfovibrio aestuarii]|uniref:Uncharacterized protein n=1 Tax=Halodesulfovibrio aestuarii TaxID=126333 RepID=A0ABV4JTV1_9BACT
MSNEVELAWAGVCTELIKLGHSLGAAFVTGLFGFFMGKLDYKRKLKDIESQQELLARESVFNFKKEQYQKAVEGSALANEGIGKVIGELVTVESLPDQEVPLQMGVRALQIFVSALKNEARSFINFANDKNTYAAEKESIENILKTLEQFEEPTSVTEALDCIITVREYYYTLHKVSGSAFEEEMTGIFKKYLDQ